MQLGQLEWNVVQFGLFAADMFHVDPNAAGELLRAELVVLGAGAEHL